MAQAVAKEALTWDRTAYLERVVQNSEESMKEGTEDKDSSDTDILDEAEEATEEDEKPPRRCCLCIVHLMMCMCCAVGDKVRFVGDKMKSSL